MPSKSGKTGNIGKVRSKSGLTKPSKGQNSPKSRNMQGLKSGSNPTLQSSKRAASRGTHGPSSGFGDNDSANEGLDSDSQNTGNTAVAQAESLSKPNNRGVQEPPSLIKPGSPTDQLLAHLSSIPAALVPTMGELFPARKKDAASTHTINGKRTGLRTGVGWSALHLMPATVYVAFIQRIKLGTHAHIAAHSLGITTECYSRWFKKGQTSKGGLYRRFFLDVIQAQGEARMLREMHVASLDPLAWLTKGPGKTKSADEPGWTEVREIHQTVDANSTITAKTTFTPDADAVKQMMAEFAELGLIELTVKGQALLGVSQVIEDDEADENIVDAESVQESE